MRTIIAALVATLAFSACSAGGSLIPNAQSNGASFSPNSHSVSMPVKAVAPTPKPASESGSQLKTSKPVGTGATTLSGSPSATHASKGVIGTPIKCKSDIGCPISAPPPPTILT